MRAGRTLRGKVEDDFKTLTNDPQRRIVLVLGEDGLASLQGLNGFEILKRLGHHPDHIQRCVESGHCFRFATWRPQTEYPLATWDNIIDLVEQAWPELPSIRPYRKALASTPFSNIEQQAGYRFAETDRPPPRVSNLVEVREFLYHYVHLRELYTGDGYTMDILGHRGPAEYCTFNVPLSELDDVQITNLQL